MTGAFDDDPTDNAARPKGLLGGGLPTVFQDATVVVKAPVGTTLESIPAPRPPAGEGDLSPDEEKALEACKAGVTNLHQAFWIAGKSLETIATGNLHRTSGQPNFADFVWTNWEISESQIYRLMDEWRVGEALSQMGWNPRESQVRELVDIKSAAGDRAAVAVYDAVARTVAPTGKRVTARLLGEVARSLPPLSPESSPAEITKLVRDILAPPAPRPEPSASPKSAAEVTAGQTGEVSTNGSGGPVHTITEVGNNSDSPIGESEAQPSNPKESAAKADDLARLNEALALLREAARSISKPAVRRALEQDPQTAQAVLDEIDTNLNKIGRAVAVQRPT
ncbi:hypothetical protein [Streptomyces chartreusis]|uniref:hypothetical protein n=1 Tax=Streptomyces chartreusis TaxID=1969 RepID=UPI00381CBD37